MTAYETNPFNEYVPIISVENERSGFNHSVFIFNVIESSERYSELCFILENATENDWIEFKFNTPGGDYYTALVILAAMEKCKAPIHGVGYGDIASAGTMLLLACDTIFMNPYAEFMIHNFSESSGQLKGNELVRKYEFTLPHRKKVFYKFYEGFLTKEECDKVVRDDDIYLNAEEVMSRFDKVTMMRLEAYKSTLAEQKEEYRKELQLELAALDSSS